MLSMHLPSFLPPSVPFSTLSPTSTPLPSPSPSSYLLRITHVSPQQVDLLYARGQHQNTHPTKGHIRPPFTLGLDFSAVVLRPPLAPPQGHPALPPGTRVFGSHIGAFATHLAAPAAAVQPVPAGVTGADAAALSSGVVAWAAVVKVACVRAGQVVLVTGAPGGLVLVAAQIAAARGARVLVLARTEGRARAVRGLAVATGWDVLGAEGDWRGEVERLTGGRGVDVVVDQVGVVKEGLRVLRFGGTIVLVGFAGRGGVMEQVGMDRVLLKGARVVGFRYGEGIRKGQIDGDECWRGYLECLRSGAVKAVIDEKNYRGLKQVGRAMQDLADGVLVGKAVVEFDENAQDRIANL